MGTHRARKAAPGVRSTRLDCKTAAPTSDRTSNRSNRTNRGAAGPVVRLDRVIDPTRLERTREPHHQQKRRPVHLHLLLPGHGAMPPQPGHGKTATPLPFNDQPSFHRNANHTAIPSNRSSVVPAERHLRASGADDRTILGSGKAPRPHQPTGLKSHHPVPSERSTVRSSRTPSRRPDRSSTTRPGGLRFASPDLAHTMRPGQRAEPPTSTRHQRQITPCR